MRKLESAIRHFFRPEKAEEAEDPSPVDAIVRLLKADAQKERSMRGRRHRYRGRRLSPEPNAGQTRLEEKKPPGRRSAPP